MKNRQTDKLPSKLSANREHEIAIQGIWSGTISFSLVAIPVQLVKAIEPAESLFACSTAKIIPLS